MSDYTQKAGWAFSKETLKLLNINVAQIKGIQKDGEQSVDELSTSFVSIATTLQKLINSEADAQSTDLLDIQNQLQQVIIAFQFYDRISQRLDHVSSSLTKIGDIICDESVRDQAEAWLQLQSDIKNNLTMDSEKKLFDQIYNGVNVDTALKSYRVTKPPLSDDTTELF